MTAPLQATEYLACSDFRELFPIMHRPPNSLFSRMQEVLDGLPAEDPECQDCGKRSQYCECEW